MERVLLFSVISLVGFVRDVERNRAHNPKVVSSNLTPATISKTCFMTGLRDSWRANWEQVLVTQFAQLKSQASLLAPFPTISDVYVQLCSVAIY